MPRLEIRITAVSLLLMIPIFSHSQTLTQATSVSYEAQIGRNEDGFSSCGIHAMAVVATGKVASVYDFSVNVRADAYGAIKAGKHNISISDLLAGKDNKKTVIPAPINFWIAMSDSDASLRPIKYIPADSEGFILGVTDFVKSAETIFSMAAGERMQFATRYKSENADSVISISGELSEVERESLRSCFLGLMRQIKQKVKPKP